MELGLFLKREDFNVSDSGISLVEKVQIGGVDQCILLQGENTNNPILFFLHGGPSLPLPGVSCRGKDYTIVTNTKELVKHFTIVYWDQRGTGKSYSKSIGPNSMNISQFVHDANELTEYLRRRFQQEKIFLVGHSWGTILGLTLINLYPEKFHSYFGISQIINWVENDRVALQWAKEEAKKRKNHKALMELNAVGEPPFIESFEQWGVLRKWQARFNSMIYSEGEIKHPGLFQISKVMFTSKDYSLRDIYHSFYKGFKLVYTHDFINEIPNINFLQTSKKVDILITFIHGSKDVHVGSGLVEDYYEHIETSRGKQFIKMEKSAHIFHPEDTKKIEEILIAERKHANKSLFIQ